MVIATSSVHKAPWDHLRGISTLVLLIIIVWFWPCLLESNFGTILQNMWITYMYNTICKILVKVKVVIGSIVVWNPCHHIWRCWVEIFYHNRWAEFPNQVQGKVMMAAMHWFCSIGLFIQHCTPTVLSTHRICVLWNSSIRFVWHSYYKSSKSHSAVFQLICIAWVELQHLSIHR